MRTAHLTWLACVLACAGCSAETVDAESVPPHACEAEDLPPGAPAFGDDAAIPYATRADGLAVHDRRIGEGDVVAGEASVAIAYTGFLMDGCPFDTTLARGPMVLPLGSAIAGIREGLQGMRVGGARRVFVPAHLGYGEAGAGPIPGGADLVFEFELLGVQ